VNGLLQLKTTCQGLSEAQVLATGFRVAAFSSIRDDHPNPARFDIVFSEPSPQP
jgi:hypothetical protein